MTYPSNLTKADIDEVLADGLRRKLPVIEAVQHAIQRFPLAMEVKPTQKEPRT